ncbi:MAG: site-2 protease family protein [Candidatus Thalassarchaeum sp.]|nr:site-2 protease family protein [Candidatus Thalassarchaeum sp.]
MSDTRAARDRRALILIFVSAFLAAQWHWAFGALGLWVLILGQFERRGILDKWNATRVLGGLLMLRSNRGQETIEKVAKPRAFWRLYGEVSMWTCFFVMIFIVLFLLLSFGSALIYGVPKSDAPASQLIVLPGINPIIPFWWPAIAFVGALVIHEFAHALQARAHGMRVRSVGLLMLGPFPAGAFVEPEFEELTKAPRRERARLFAAAPATNMYAGLLSWLLICLLASQFSVINPGVHANGIIEDTAAADSGLQPWEIITHFDGTPVPTAGDMTEQLDAHSAGDTVNLTVLSHPNENQLRTERVISVTLSSKWDYLKSQNMTDSEIESMGVDEDDAFLGVSGMSSGSSGIDRLVGPMAWETNQPLYVDALGVAVQPFVLIGIPIGFEGQIMTPQEMEFIEADGWLGDILGTTVLMAIITLLFWFIWWNFGLGLANLIPIIPFDGGHLMKDFLGVVVGGIHRFTRHPHALKTELTVSKISSFSSLFLFMGLLLIIIAQQL